MRICRYRSNNNIKKNFSDTLQIGSKPDRRISNGLKPPARGILAYIKLLN